MTVDNSTELIRRVLNEFDLLPPEAELLKSIDDCNAKIVTERGDFFLKVLVSDHTAANVHARLAFADFLRDGGLSVPSVLATKSGCRFASVHANGQQRQAVMSGWIDGDTPGPKAKDGQVERCGELLARLHVRSQQFDPPDECKFRVWDDVYINAENEWLIQFLSSSPVSETNKEILKQAASRTKRISAGLPQDRRNYGLIHADIHGDNLIFDGETTWIVDLDDVGWGHFLFDVAWLAVILKWSRSHLSE